jgi:hypothetical protein
MKHLINRDDFLRNIKRSEIKSDVLMDRSISKMPEIIKEASNAGPFVNEVSWNDSLLGRLVNHIIRKTKIALNMIRIKPVIMRLRSEFDNLVAEGYLTGADGDQKLEIFRIKISEILWEIQNTIEQEGKISYLKQLVNSANDIIKENEQYKTEIESFGQLEDEMIAFSEFLNQFKDETIEDEEGSEEGSEEDEIDTPEGESLLADFRKNLDALKGIIEQVVTIQAGAPAAPQPTGKGTSQPQNSSYKFNEALTSNDPEVNKALSKLKDSYTKSLSQVLDVNKTQGLVDMIDDDPYEIAYVYSEIKRLLKGDKQDFLADVKGTLGKLNEADSTNIKSIHIGIAKFSLRTAQFTGSILGKIPNPLQSNIKKFNETLEKIIGTDFEKALPGLAKWKENKIASGRKFESRIGSYEEFVSETMVSRGIGKAGAKISKLFKRGKGDDKSDVDQGDDKSDVKGDMNPPQEPPQGDQSQDYSEGDGEPSDPDTGSTWERIRIYWERKCKTTKRFVLDRTESDKIRVNIEKLKEGGSFCINGMDPVIQIARLFNRAYKIYTTNTITRRNDGKVDARTWEEYESFGGNSSGNINGWAGPFRNKKIFNQWENAVMKIIGDRKYEFIFSSSTALRLPKVSNPKKESDFEMRQGAGAKLRNFMLDMLDGDELYKSGSDKGAQKNFLEKYFGKIDDNRIESLTITKKEGEENQEIVEKISESAIDLKFMKVRNDNIGKGQTFLVKCRTKHEGKWTENLENRYFYINSGDQNIAYLSLSRTFHYFNELLRKCPNKEETDARMKKIVKGDITKIEMDRSFKNKEGENSNFVVRYTKIKGFAQLFTKGSKLKLQYVGNERNNVEVEEILVDEIYWLCMEEDGNNIPYSANMDPEWIRKNISKFGDNYRISNVENHIKVTNIDGITRL